MQQGAFYSTTGVILKTLEFDEEGRTLTVAVDAKKGVNYRIEFIGSHKSVSLAHEHVASVADRKGLMHPVSPEYLDDRIGMTFQESEGPEAVYRMTGDELYVRAVIHSDASPYFKYDDFSDFEQKAWTQPVGFEE